MIKNDAKALLKTIKSDFRERVGVVVDLAGFNWEQDEDGRWVERPE